MGAARFLPSIICLLFSFFVVRREGTGGAVVAAAVSAPTHDFLTKVQKAIQLVRNNETAWREHLRLFSGHDDQSLFSPEGFPCTRLPPSPVYPKSVHEVRPGDVRVIGAIGDGAGTAIAALATTPDQLKKEWRRRSWSIGGDATIDQVVTLPNFIRAYNPDVKGFYLEGKADFDVSMTGSTVEDLPKQAENLVNRIRNDDSIDFANDWKLVTISVGRQDLCAFDARKSHHDPKRLNDATFQTLQTLKAMPRTFVNLVAPADVAALTSRLAKVSPVCGVVLKELCPDFAGGDAGKIAEGQEIRHRYAKVWDALAGEFEVWDNFTVVQQPVFNMGPQLQVNRDLSLFAPDCFHLSAKGHAMAALSAWSNLFAPEHQKRLLWNRKTDLVCPSEADPFLKTAKNSYPRRGASTGSLGGVNASMSWNEEFDAYPADTGSAVTWGFVALLIGIVVVAALFYIVKTRESRRQDSERSGLLNFEEEDTVFEQRHRLGRGGHAGSNAESVAMETIRSRVATA